MISRTIIVSSLNATQRSMAYDKAVELFGRKSVLDKPNLNAFTIQQDGFIVDFLDVVLFERNLTLLKEYIREKFTYGDGTATVAIDEI